MMGRWWGTLAFALLLAPIAARADKAEIEHRCTVQYPSITQYFAWKDCVKTETEQEAAAAAQRAVEEFKRQQEEEARPCLAADIPRMEGLAQKVKAAIKSETSLEEAQSALEPIIGQRGEIQIAKDRIKERVLVTYVHTRCPSSFHFLINVREGADKKLRWLSVFAEYAPAGYMTDLHPEFSTDFDQQRDEERRRAEDAQFRERMAAEDKSRAEQHQKFLHSVKISNVKVRCASAASCSWRYVDLLLTNTSQEPVRDVSLG